MSIKLTFKRLHRNYRPYKGGRGIAYLKRSMKTFVLLILLSLTQPAYSYYYDMQDFNGLGHLDYQTSLAELEATIKDVVLNLSQLKEKYSPTTRSNVYETSLFNSQLNTDIHILQLKTKELPRKIKFLYDDLNMYKNRFVNFDFPFIELLNLEDKRIFEDTKAQLNEDHQRMELDSSKIIQQSKELHQRLESFLLKRRKVSKYTYKEYTVISKSHGAELQVLLKQAQALYSAILDLTPQLETQRKITSNVFESYLRKLKISIGVRDSESLHKAYEKFVTEALNQLRKKIETDRSTVNPEKNIFTYDFYLNKLLKISVYSEALTYMGQMILSKAETFSLADKNNGLQMAVMDFYNGPKQIKPLTRFIERNYKINNCKAIF